MHLQPLFLPFISLSTTVIISFLTTLIHTQSLLPTTTSLPSSTTPFQQIWPTAFGARPTDPPAKLGIPYIEPFPDLSEIGQANCHVYGPKPPLVDCLQAMKKMPLMSPDEAMACPVDHVETRFWQHGWCRISFHDNTGLAECIHPHDLYLSVRSILENCTEIPRNIPKFNKEGPLVTGYMALPLPKEFMQIAGPNWHRRYKRELFVTRVPVISKEEIGQSFRLGDEPKRNWNDPGAVPYARAKGFKGASNNEFDSDDVEQWREGRWKEQ